MKEVRNYVNNLCTINCCCRLWKEVVGFLHFKIFFINWVNNVFKTQSNKKFSFSHNLDWLPN